MKDLYHSITLLARITVKLLSVCAVPSWRYARHLHIAAFKNRFPVLFCCPSLFFLSFGPAMLSLSFFNFSPVSVHLLPSPSLPFLTLICGVIPGTIFELRMRVGEFYCIKKINIRMCTFLARFLTVSVEFR
jgi:hypothetical protein